MKDEPLWLWWLFLTLLLESEALFFFPATFASTTSTSSSLIYKLWSLKANVKLTSHEKTPKSPQLKYPMSYGIWDLWSTPQQKQDFPPPKKKKTRKHPCLVDLGTSIVRWTKERLRLISQQSEQKQAGFSLSFHFTTSRLTRIWDFVQK